MGNDTSLDDGMEESGNDRPEIEIRKPVTQRNRRRTERRSQGFGFSLFGNKKHSEPAAGQDITRVVKPGFPQEQESPRQAAGAAYKPVRLGIDVLLIVVVSTLVIFGLLMVNSASWKFSLDWYKSPTAVFERQLVWTLFGIGATVILAIFDYHRFQKIAVFMMPLVILALLIVLFVHDERNGAVRTLTGGSIQPSELAKLVLVIYLAVWLFNRGEELQQVSFGLFPLAVILGVLGGLIIMQPDISAVITIFILGGMMFFLAGGDLRQIVVVLVLGSLIGWLVVSSNVMPYGKDRVTSFMAGLKDPLQASSHVQRSMESFVKGGFFGVGIGKADTKLTVLPFPHTDSIFAVVGEETGVLGASCLVVLYALMMWRGLTIAKHAPDRLGMLLAGGLSFWLAMEAFINMAVMVGLLPFAGNALPLISAGGSNRLVTLAAIGILLNISRLSHESKEEKERAFSAVIDLRRRDWRRGIPRPRRPSVTR